MKKFAITVCLGAVLLSTTASAGFADVSTAIEEHKLETISDLPPKSKFTLYEAEKAREAEKYDEAVEIISDYLRKHPDRDHYLLRYHLAANLVLNEKLEQALENFQATVALEKYFRPGWLSLGEVGYSLNRYDIAAEAFIRGAELGSEKAPHLIYYAAAAYVLGSQPAKAIPLLEDLTSGAYGPVNRDWFRALVSACLDLEDKARGEKAISNLLKQFSDDPEAWFLAFQYAACTQDFQQAAVALTITGYLRPLTKEEESQLGDLYSVIGVPAQASLHYQNAADEGGTTKEFERLASAYLATHDTKSAMLVLNKALEEEPTYRLWSLLGDLYYIEKDYRHAYDAFEQCSKLDEDQGRPYLMMGYCKLELGYIEESIPLLERAVEYQNQEKIAAELLRRAKSTPPEDSKTVVSGTDQTGGL
jgi:tetratricopeptide (TPR) repeat protein